MLRISVLAAVAGVAFATASPVCAQQAGAAPRAIVSAGVTEANWQAIRGEARTQARRARVSEAALLAAAEAAGVTFARSGRFNAQSLQQAIFEGLASQADQIGELQQRLDALSGGDAAAAALFAQARAALDAGRLDEADRLLAQAAQNDLAAMRQADAEAQRRRLRAGETIAGRGQLAFVQADFLGAASHFSRAAQTVPQSAIEPRWEYSLRQANALRERGQRFETENLNEALRIYQEVVLPLAPRASRPEAWAQTQNNLGNALRGLGERGDSAALAPAIVAFEGALGVLTREADPQAWALTQTNLGGALFSLGARGDAALLTRAVRAFDAALTVRTREADPQRWARVQMNLGAALAFLGQRGNGAAAARAVTVLEAALTVITRESAPQDWAGVQVNLGVALQARAARGDVATLSRAAAAYEAGLTVLTPARDAQNWAGAQTNLGNVLVMLGQHGDENALARAIAAFEAALTVRTRARDPQGWADTQNSLGNAYRVQGLDAGGDAALARAVEAFEAALTVQTRARDPQGWAMAKFNLALVYGTRASRGDRSARARAISAARDALAGFEQIGHAPYTAQARRLVGDLEAIR